MVWFFSDTFIWRAEENSAGQTSVSGGFLLTDSRSVEERAGAENGRPFFWDLSAPSPGRG